MAELLGEVAFFSKSSADASEAALFTRWLQRNYVIAVLLVLALFIAPGAAGYYLCDSLWPQGLGGEAVVLGVFGPYLVAGFGASLRYKRFRAAYLHTLIAFLVSVPVIYALTSLMYAVLSSAHLYDIPVNRFLLSDLMGTLLGVGLGILFSFAAAAKATLIDDKPRDGDANFNEVFAPVLSFRLIFAFVVASLFNLPDRPAAVIALGTAWGIVAAGLMMFYVTLVAHTKISFTWVLVAIYEAIFGVILIWDIVFSFIGWMKFEPMLELALPALTALPATCGLACLIIVKGPQAIRIMCHLIRNSPPGSSREEQQDQLSSHIP